jgi:hypothetical protein
LIFLNEIVLLRIAFLLRLPRYCECKPVGMLVVINVCVAAALILLQMASDDM